MNYLKKILCMTLVLFVANQGFGWVYSEDGLELPYESGSGTKNDPYIINTAQQLADLAFIVNNGTDFSGEYFKLGRDIDLNPGIIFDPENAGSYAEAKAWTPIGFKNAFKGFFDGDNHVIKGLYFKGDNVSQYNASRTIMEGLFGHIEDGSLCNLTITNSLIAYDVNRNEITGTVSAFFVADLMNSDLYNLKNEGNVRVVYNGEENVWGPSILITGIVGYVNIYEYPKSKNSIIKSCENHGSMKLAAGYQDSFNLTTIDSGLFGIIGTGSDVQLTDCHNYGNIDGNGIVYCAGIGNSIGSDGIYRKNEFYNLTNSGDINGGAGLFIMAGAGVLKDSYNTGNITNGCGLIDDCKFLSLINCYNTGDINDEKGRGVAGLIGYSDYLSKMENCYNTGNVYSIASTAGLIGGIAENDGIILKDCYNTGDITSETRGAGGLVGSGPLHSKLNLENCVNKGLIKGVSGCGGLLGDLLGEASFVKCRNEEDVMGTSYVGGIAGKVSYLDIIDSGNIGNISATVDRLGRSNAGGLVGSCSSGGIDHVIKRSFNTGKVSGEGKYVGGIGGCAAYTSECYNTGDVSGKSCVAGIASSSAFGIEEMVMINCYNVGSVSGEDFVAGLCSNLNGVAKYCYNYGVVECQSNNRALLWIYGYDMYDDVLSSECYSLPKDDFPVCVHYVGADMTLVIKDRCETRTQEEFNNGSVCVLLNGDQDPTPWGQDLETDPYPLLNGKGNPDMGGIESVNGVEIGLPDKIYTLDGREITLRSRDDIKNLPKGIYIVNGKKIVK